MGLLWKIVAAALAVVVAGVVVLFVVFPDRIPESVSTWVPGHEAEDGPQFVLELDVEDLRRQRLNTLREEVRRALREGRIAGAAVIVGSGIEVRLREGVDRAQALAKLNELLQSPVGGAAGGPRSLEIASGDGGVIRITQTEAAVAEQVRGALADSVRITERRLADLGRSSVRPQGLTQILVRVPAGRDAKAMIDVATRIGRLEFRMIDVSMTPEAAVQGNPPPDSEVLYDADKLPYLVEKRVLLSGRDVVDSQAAFDQRTNEPIVTFRFNAAGARRFAEITQENVGRPFAIVLDNVVRSAPVIREPILGGSGQISGQFTVQQANEVALLLRAGQLPARLVVVEQ
jgi:preprotein translocase subunit SecD